jgi:glycosyltransferase involved in cell wall biosynthesis
MLGDLRRFTEDLGGSLVALGRRDDIAVLIGAADAMLLCSRVEGLPNVLVEAQALGCPVVATDAGGTRETMQPGATGFLREIGDIAGLTGDILRLIDDAALRASVSAEARAFARGRFPLERMVRETHALYGVGDGGI